MRVNVYAEEITPRVEIVFKKAEGKTFVGVRFYLELPVTLGSAQAKGPFMHGPNDDDSSAITFWGRKETKAALEKGLELLEKWNDYEVARVQQLVPEENQKNA